MDWSGVLLRRLFFRLGARTYILRLLLIPFQDRPSHANTTNFSRYK